ncbi:hypothetical protein [Pseudomonas phage PPpW-3]|uniref:Phage tail assembly protein n=1 Tax=Pseudomonas phage PPpW-3 TaxID=1279082 RepID=V5YST8_9CAUD|nr:tail protein [Pseudomonas phage PPpW-3]BAO20620.1 hypothetical protein [Pseudomonas phage PPpW-3]
MAKTPEWLKYNDDGSVDITLSKPSIVSGVKTSTVRMREPLVQDQEAAAEMAGSDAAREITVFANLCDLAPEDIRKLPMREFKRLQTAYLGFID